LIFNFSSKVGFQRFVFSNVVLTTLKISGSTKASQALYADQNAESNSLTYLCINVVTDT
jgi:hypothetical protein